MKVQACFMDWDLDHTMCTRAVLLNLRARNKDPRCIPRAMEENAILGLEQTTVRSKIVYY